MVFNTGFSLRRHGQLWGELGQIRWGEKRRNSYHLRGLFETGKARASHVKGWGGWLAIH